MRRGTMYDAHALLGRTLDGHLRLTDFLGEGAMGIVCRGVDTRTMSDVAVKILHPVLAVHPEVVARFYREGAAARRVDHRNAVRMLGRGRDQGLCYLVMELLDGRTLSDLLHAEGRIAQTRAARLVAQLCEALSVAHRRGVVHRDIKPGNVMISAGPAGEQAKLLDYGVAKHVPHGDPRLAPLEDSFCGPDSIACGALVGTPEYMAPEQCCALPVDARTDVYACGVMLYRAITGRVPFTADTVLEICQLHLAEPPRPPRELVPGLDAVLEAVILKALAKAPEARQQSALELRRELLAALEAIAAEEAEPTETFARADLPRAATPPPRPAAGSIGFWVACAAGMSSTLPMLSLILSC